MGKFDNFSVKKGKALLKEEVLNQLMNNGVYIIGLGGLGGRTVNQIKKVFYDKIDMTKARGRVRFLVVDSDSDSTDSIRDSQNGGMIDLEEVFHIVDADAAVELDNAPDSIKKFMKTESFPGVIITADGCQQTRQFGRALLCNRDLYTNLKNKIQSDLTVIQNEVEITKDNIRILVFAGISGGTGSGTIIDIGYMLRRIIDVDLAAPTNVSVDGYVYLSDVQENDEALKGVDQTQLRANCYAALKEINYFLDLNAVKGTYKYPIDFYGTSNKNIFDHCTIISRYSDGGIGMVTSDSNGVIDIVADHVCFLVSQSNLVDEKGKNIQGLLSDGSNEPPVINTFVMNHKNLPDWGMYRYRALSYGDYYLPRDEMIAFIANSLVQKMKEKWENGFDKTKQIHAIQGILTNLKLDSIDNFVNAAYLAVRGDRKKIDSMEDADIYPKAFSVPKIGLGKIQKLELCYGACQTKSKIGKLDEALYSQFVSPDTPTSIVRNIQNAVDQAFQDKKKGPYFAINLLSATTNHAGFKGIMVKLDELRLQAQGAINKYRISCEDKQNQILRLQEELKNGITEKTQENADHFARQCNEYIKLLIQYDICLHLVDHDDKKGVITKIISEVEKLNKKLYSKFTILAEELSKMLKEDNDYVINPQRKREDTGEVFTFDVTNCDTGDNKWVKLQNYFTTYLQPEAVNQACDDFIDQVIVTIYNQYTTTPNQDITDDDLREVIREFFNNFFNPIIGDFLEKICVVAFSKNALTPDDVENIWNDPEQKTNALKHVAQCIKNVIGENVLLDCKDGFTPEFKDFNGYSAVRLLQETANISKLLSDLMAGPRQVIGYSNSTDSSFYTAKLTYGAPLFLINQMSSLQSAYQLKKIFAGIHLDEKSADWMNFPEPFGYVEAQFLGQPVDTDAFASDKKIYDDIFDHVKKLMAYGMILDLDGIQNFYGFDDTTCIKDDIDKDLKHDIDPDKPFKHLLCVNLNLVKEANEELLSKFKAFVQQQLDEDENKTLAKLLKDFGCKTDTPVALRLKLDSRIEFYSDYAGIGERDHYGNLIKIIRRSPRLIKIMKEKVNDLDPYARIYNEIKFLLEKQKQYIRNFDTFVLALKYGLIQHDIDNNCWCYSIEDNGIKSVLVISQKVVMRGARQIKKEFQLYHVFKEYCDMDEKEKFDKYVKLIHDSNLGTLVNREDIDDEVNRVLKNPEYLNNQMVFNFVRDFKEEATRDDSDVSYDYPNPIENIRTEEGVKTAIQNVKDFYMKLKKEKLNQVV